MQTKVMPFIALPVRWMFRMMEYLVREADGQLTEAQLKIAFAELTGNKAKTTENYVRSLRYLGLVEVREGVVSATGIGCQLVSAGPHAWQQVLQQYLEAIPQIRDIMDAVTDLGLEGYPLTSNGWYYSMVCKRLVTSYGYGSVSVRRVDNYISLFREIGSLSMISAVPVRQAVTSPDDLLVLLRYAFEEVKNRNPLLRKMPWLPIGELERIVVDKTSLSSSSFWDYLLKLRVDKKVTLVQTKPDIAAQAGMKLFYAHGIAYGSVALRGDR